MAWSTCPWRVIEAKIAPWVDGKGAKPEIDSGIAKAKLIFTENSVQGPQPLGCAKARFTVSIVGAELRSPERYLHNKLKPLKGHLGNESDDRYRQE